MSSLLLLQGEVILSEFGKTERRRREGEHAGPWS